MGLPEKDWALTTLLWVLAVLSVGLWAFVIGTLQPRVYGTNHEVADAICDYSYAVVSREWEEACGMALDIIEGRE